MGNPNVCLMALPPVLKIHSAPLGGRKSLTVGINPLTAEALAANLIQVWEA
jgi:hypothetical protein